MAESFPEDETSNGRLYHCRVRLTIPYEVKHGVFKEREMAMLRRAERVIARAMFGVKVLAKKKLIKR